MMTMKRREFISRGVATVLLTSVPSWAMQRSKSGKLDRLACNSWPFRGYFDTPQMATYRDSQFPLLTQADFPQFLADHLKIHNVEFLPQHFVDTDPSTIDKVKTGLKKANSRCCNLMGVELPGGVYKQGADVQALTSEAERWIAVAVALGSPVITIALNGKERPDAGVAAHNLEPAVEAAHRKGIKVLFHNDSIERESRSC